MFCTIYGDPMYLIEGKHNQNHQANIYYIHELSDTELFLINITIRYIHTNTPPNPPETTIGSYPA